jgi:hypothetical protein
MGSAASKNEDRVNKWVDETWNVTSISALDKLIERIAKETAEKPLYDPDGTYRRRINYAQTERRKELEKSGSVVPSKGPKVPNMQPRLHF